MKGWAEENKHGSKLTKFCHPFEVKKTWNEPELSTLLRNATNGCYKNLLQEPTRIEDNDRRPLVVSIRAGLGNGKTHALQQAPRLLDALGVYITYNGSQGISKDAKQAGKCVLLRILFALLGTENYGAARFLDKEEMYQLWTSASSDYLVELTAHGAAQVLDSKSHLCICVDELRKLKSDNNNLQVQELLSTLGRLTEELHKLKPPIRCSVLVSALTDSTIETKSSRKLEPLLLPPVDHTALEHMNQVLRKVETADWRVEAVAGHHIRSMVVGTDFISKGHSHVELPALMDEVYDRLDHTVTVDEAQAVVAYVKSSCKGESLGMGSDNVQLLTGRDGAIPPPILITCLRKVDPFTKASKRALAIFGDHSLRHTPKQLEATAMQYDLLRSIWKLNVLPEGIEVKNNSDGLTLYRDLLFQDLELDYSDLFKKQGKGKQQEIVWTGLKPTIGKYFHPDTANHPYIDRFFVASDGKIGSTQCLVLYQDKVNSASFSEAVKKLMKAVDLLKPFLEEMKMRVLCIANVIGAGETGAQSNFTVPYVLVRDTGKEIEAFYSVHFAPAIRHMRRKWIEEQRLPIDDVAS